MKVVLVSTYEKSGGAAIACYRLKESLRENGVDATLMTAYKTSDDPTVISPFGTTWERLLNRFHFYKERLAIFVKNGFSRKNLFAISIADSGTDISHHPAIQNADVIHLHWINQGFLSLQNIQQLMALGKPVVFTMHDMWFCTAVCHYSYACNRFMTLCCDCPFLQKKGSSDLAYSVWLKKQFFRNSDAVFVCVSRWLAANAAESGLTDSNRILVIPNVIDTKVFYPCNRDEERAFRNISGTDKMVVFGAAKLNAEIKGFKLLKEALESSKYCSEIHLFLFGAIKDDPDFLKNIPCRYTYLGTINNPGELAALYSAADVTVVPSHYETFGQTLAESMACGTPVVSFNNSGQTDIIDHLENGYLVTYPFTRDFAEGIDWIFDHSGEDMRRKCVEKVARSFSSGTVALQYVDLYNELLSQNPNENK